MRVPQEVEVEGLFDGDGDLLAVFVVEGECSVDVVEVGNVLVVFCGESKPVVAQTVDVDVMGKEDGIRNGVLVGRHSCTLVQICLGPWGRISCPCHRSRRICTPRRAM